MGLITTELKPYAADPLEAWELYLGDQLEVLRSFPDNSVDAAVVDPPYGLGKEPDALAMLRDWMDHDYHDVKGAGFMGKKWDAFVTQPIVWKELRRVLKPGAFLLSFAGTRTYDLMTLSIRIGGFSIRDCIRDLNGDEHYPAWVYGSGFPKSHNLDGDWEGYGTALKPAWEPIVIGEKVCEGTVAENMARWGVGALNIDACRVNGEKDWPTSRSHKPASHAEYLPENGRVHELQSTDYDGLGRWPANVIHDGSPAVLANFPDAPGQQATVTGNEPTANGFSGPVKYSGMRQRVASDEPREETTRSAHRFFYCAKASREDRNEGLLNPGPQLKHGTTLRNAENAEFRGNHHPTVKPVALMRYLCRLVAPPGGTIIDISCGSGSTGKGAIREQQKFIGIDNEEGYLEIAAARLRHETKQPALFGG